MGISRVSPSSHSWSLRCVSARIFPSFHPIFASLLAASIPSVTSLLHVPRTKLSEQRQSFLFACLIDCLIPLTHTRTLSLLSCATVYVGHRAVPFSAEVSVSFLCFFFPSELEFGLSTGLVVERVVVVILEPIVTFYELRSDLRICPKRKERR